MKKVSLFLAALALAVSAQAGVQVKSHRALSNNRPFLSTETESKGNSLNMITTQPEGELKVYKRSGQTLDGNGGYVTPTTQSGECNIVYAPDGRTIYMQDPISGYKTGAWVEGTIDGNTITVPLGQELEYDSYYDAFVVLTFGTTYYYYENGGKYIEVDDTGYEVATFTIDGNTIRLNGSAGDVYAYGDDAYIATGLAAKWSDVNSWSGDLDMLTVLTEVQTQPDDPDPIDVPTVISEVPEGTLLTYHRTGGYIYHKFLETGITEFEDDMNVVFAEDGKVYIQNPITTLTNGNWVEGTYDQESGIISIPTGQCVSWMVNAGYGGLLVWGHTWYEQIGWDYDYDEPVYWLYGAYDPDVTEIRYQVEGNTITLLDGQGDVWAPYPEWGNTTGPCLIYTDTKDWANVLLFSTVAVLTDQGPAVPANPTADSWYDCGDEYGASMFSFTLPTTDINGNPINPENLSYSIYLDDDEIFTFDTFYYYYDVESDMTVIPYSIYSNGYDITNDAVYIYGTNYCDWPIFTWRIGIKVYYTVGSITNESDIVYLEVFPNPNPGTAVNEVNAGKTVAGVRYYNVAGQEMAEPQGLTIQVTTYTDGTTSTVKVVK